MFKESIESINYSPFNNSKEIIYTKINEIFEDEENKEKFILINIFSAKIRNVINNLNEMDDKKNVLKEDNKEAIEKLIEFYPKKIKERKSQTKDLQYNRTHIKIKRYIKV